MTLPSRKQKGNLGYVPQGLPTTNVNASVLMVDRLVFRLLRASIAQLVASPALAERYFAHFFDVTTSVKERESFTKSFLTAPPRVALGYARLGADMPCYAVVMSEETEAE